MYHELFSQASFWAFLLTIDQELAEKCRQERCSCGGRLHRANYWRKPRGTAVRLSQQFCLRFSFCCEREGCRKRVTPPSVRFLGRKVFLGAIVVLAAAMRQGPSPRRVRELTERFDVDRKTIQRWRVLWSEHFPQSTFWRSAAARLAPLLQVVEFPRCLLEYFVLSAKDREGWGKLLRFLSPMTTAKGLENTAF